MNVLIPPLKSSSLKHLWDLIGFVKTTKKTVREAIKLTVVKSTPGPKKCLLKD